MFKFLKKINVIKVSLVVIICILFLAIFIFRDRIPFIEVLSSKELLMREIDSYGIMAPMVFVFVQALQVLFAPIPGEVSGLAGGYVFGAFKGFLLSSFALTIGSVINFVLARYVGKDIVRNLLPEKYFTRFDRFFEEEGKVFVFALFLFPGFPKDYFCLFLGITNMRFYLFFIFVLIGRMPGTLLLSIQGEMLYEGQYIFTGILALFTGVFSLLLIVYRKKLYLLIKKRR